MGKRSYYISNHGEEEEEEEEKLNEIIMLEAILEISRARLGDFACEQNCWESGKENYR